MHIAIYLSNQDDKSHIVKIIQQGLLTELVTLVDKRIAIYSKECLQHFLQEEYRHDRFDLTGSADKPLSLMSEGEQKKALLQALLAQHPDVLVVDDIFDSLDVSSQQELLQQLQQIAEHCQIIQLFTRQRDQLAFIHRVYQWQAGCLVDFDGVQAMTVDTAKAIIPEPFTKPKQFADPLIILRNISIAFAERPIIHQLNWTINNGDFWQLTGPNGSGKSTLLRMISGDSPKGFGQDLHLFGQKKGSGESVWDIKKHIGYFTSSMVQHFSRYETVENMLVSGFFDSIGLYLKPQTQHYRLTQQWLQLIGLQDKAKQAFHSLSLGHQRLVLLARAMVKHPPLLILDEPASGLDDQDIQRLIQLVNTMAQTKRCAIIYVSHRHEVGIKAHKILQLIPTEQGSIGRLL